MFQETECGICYQTYNLGRRCPRQLSCKHAFCESCLLTLASSAERHGFRIACPLCRHFTRVPEEGIRGNLSVDEEIFERLASMGDVLDDDSLEESPNEELFRPSVEDPQPPRTRRAHLMRCLRRMCKKLTQGGRTNCMSDEDFKDLTMMSCYWM
ncbi:hypothetical protein DNTS_017175 [Danionella cerebrum]|uniref:E3 ubiquitin-protein ligase RNF182 n=1 Tax=Danionella cerebrum TaxID=2873325 RepID=A0A553Q6J6_9TELE|nr:hypothetical protein DNTS_017175 [Danionella translucida]